MNKVLKSVVAGFQSLGTVKLDHAGLTVIYGQSDIGKSAFIRAMYMLHRNSGSSSMVKTGETQLQVFQKLESGRIVGIQKGDGLNKYYIKAPSAAVENILSKIGRDVPEPIFFFTWNRIIAGRQGYLFRFEFFFAV